MTKIINVTYKTKDQDGVEVEREVGLREFGAGELRGLSLSDLGQLKTDALLTLLPRITVPPMIEADVNKLPAAALVKLGVEVGSFLLN